MVFLTCDETKLNFFEIQNLIFFGTDILSSIPLLLFVRWKTLKRLSFDLKQLKLYEKQVKKTILA